MNLSTAASQTNHAHPAFELIRSQVIESLNVTVEEYHHRKTGAVHFHMAAKNEENVFLVALRTVPMDSSGVAHILEHTALCGSERYPVRDPFFMMIRRSLNTFMNAFTSSDWTAYPFASQNRKDFNNLLNVYLDAVFFSRLDELDFCQEGHRIEFSESNNSNSDLVYKGIVYNEMKGAMSSVTSTLWQALCEHLYPTNTYHYNSGGEPENIPDLSYQQLKDFYKRHYHPSNAIFMTYGDISAEQHQSKFETLALSRFEKLNINIEVPEETRYLAPISVKESYAFNEEGSLTEKNHVVIGWLWGQSTNLQDMLEGQLLSSVLLDNSSSPLMRALETTDLANSPSPLCGLEDSMRELTFVCGVEGAKIENVTHIEKMILDTLQAVADKGVPQQQLESVLHQLELSQREVGGDGFPFGLQLIMAAMGSATHRGDTIGVLNLDPVLEQLRQDIKDPNFIKDLARKLLIDNPHRVTLTMTPDTKLAGRRDAAEAAKLAAIKKGLSEQQKQDIINQTNALNKRQLQKDDESILPKVGLEDVPADIRVIEGISTQLGSMPSDSYAQGTNGLVYQQILIELPPLPHELLALLPFYTNSLTELAVGDKDYLQTQAWQAEVCGGINAFTTMRADIDNEQHIKSYLVLSSNALFRNQLQQAELMQQTLQAVRFDELPRLHELLSQQRASREQSVTNSGHSLAMSAACSTMSPTAALSHQLGGLAGIQSVKTLEESLNQSDNLVHYAASLSKLHQLIMAAPKQLLLVAESDKLADCQKTIAQLWTEQNHTVSQRFKPAPVRDQTKQLWVANTQVNFCAKAYPTVTVSHPDAAALSVLGGFLRNGYLHRVIREQGGAYGGGASQDSAIAAFKFYSYRDPRLEETLNDFDQSIQWLLETDHEAEALEQAILGVISGIDKPGSPAGEAKQAFHNRLFGRNPQHRREFRQKILQVTLNDLKRVSHLYLKPELASVAIITSSSNFEQLADFIITEQLEVNTL
jgi:Zn-dependent M16 (insulinase) family peptidase